MKKHSFKTFGPFSYFRVKNKRAGKHFISAWPTSGDDAMFGWEWGTDGEPTNPSICLRIGHFNIFSYERFKIGGFTLFILGFWWLR
jgi:hypothetical protein